MNSGCNCKWGGCVPSKIAKILLFIGGLNWGLVGIGMFMNTNLNIVHMILGSVPMLEAIVYILVGVAAIMKIFGCKCKKCKANCAACSCSTGSSDNKTEVGM
ncbi:MAG: DUF378 domain-containing protein [Patescibacteria group bacterium]|nr:DUF378 domain-containing protein [Patescibacteria group bacterium]